MRVLILFSTIALLAISVWLFSDSEAEAQRSYGGAAIVTPPLGSQGCNLPSKTILLWEDERFKDNVYRINNICECPPNTLHAIPRPLHDNADAVQWNIPRGVVVVFYEHHNLQNKGRQYAVWGSGQDAKLDDDAIGDKISAWAWYCVGQ